MRVLYLLMMLELLGLSAKSQLSGNKSIPGDYPDLTTAINDLNTQGPGPGGVTFNVLASQTAPVGGYILTATGMSSNPVIFQGNGNTISATGTAANTDGIFKLAGSDYITINNFILTGDATVEWGVALLRKDTIAPYNACSYNNLSNLTIALDKTNTSSVGIYAGNHTTESTDIIPYAGYFVDESIHNNINSNIISSAYKGITILAYNGFTNIENNQVSNYGGSSVPAVGIQLGGAAVNGGDVRIANNSVTLQNGNMADVCGIEIIAGIYGYVMGSLTVSGNTISMSGNVGDHSLVAINCSNGPDSTYVNNNEIKDCHVASTTGSFTGILSKAGANEGNIISDNSLSGTGNMALISTSYVAVSGNRVYNNTKTGASGSLFCIRADGAGFRSISNNLIYLNAISSNSGTDSSKIFGIYASLSTNFYLPSAGIVNNQIHDLSIAGTAAPAVSALYGIYLLPPGSGTDSVTDNTIYHLDFNNSAGGSAIIKGIVTASSQLRRNRISELNAVAGPESFVYGIESLGGTLVNNMVSNLHARAANNVNAVRGINIPGNYGPEIYYNTVLLNDTSTGSNFGSSAISIESALSWIRLQNNILINKSAHGAGGYTVVLRRSSTNLVDYGPADNNLFYAGNTGPQNLIFYDGTNADQTLASFKTRVAPNDVHSRTENTLFLSTDISSNSFLRVSEAAATFAESGGHNVTGFTRDIDGEIRQGNTNYLGTGFAPDIGADEFEGQPMPLIDVGAIALLDDGQGCYGSNTEPIQINVFNYGLNAINFFVTPVTITVVVIGAITQTYNRTFNYGSLASGEYATYTVAFSDMTTPGVYLFNAYTMLAGDTTSSNNSMPQVTRVVRNLANLPDSIHFTGYDGNNLAVLFPGWYEATGVNAPMDSTSLWKSGFGLGTPGNTSARINLHSSHQNEWIVGPEFWATDSAEFKFDIAITAKDDISTPAVMGTDDTLSVMVSDNCGNSWYPIRQFTAADALSNTLTTKMISLNSLSHRRLIIALKASDGTITDPDDYDVHVDNIVLNSPFGDLGVVSLLSPGLCRYSNAEIVSVAIKNFSSVPVYLSPVFAHITIQVAGPVTATFTRTLDNFGFAPDHVVSFDMPGTLDMSLPGIYRFNASISLASDPDTSNNILPEELRTVWSNVNLPLQVDFAGYDGANLAAAFPGWNEGTGVSDPTGNESSWTSCSNLGSPGNVSAKVQLSGNTANEWIISPYLIPAAAIELKLKVALTEHGSLTNSAVMGADDKVSVMISSDCGASWISIKDFTAADALTPALTEFTIYNPSYAERKILVALRATDGLIDDPNDYDFHIDDLQLQTASYPLPVELLSFSGQRTGNANLLKWSTASEQNAKRFQVERSADAVHYDQVGFVNSKAPGGNSTVQLDYEFTDNNLTGDKQYYRLRLYDFDGKNKLSNVILIRNINPATLVLAGLSPNPATNKLLVEIQTPYHDVIKIVAVNNMGQIVKEKTAVIEKGANTIDFDVQSLTPGIYILKLSSKENGSAVVGKFVKQ